MNTHRGQAGFTLTEMLIVVVIAAVAITWIMTMGKRAQAVARETEAMTLQSELAQGVGRAFAGTRAYGTNANLVPVLDDFGYIPSGARVVRGGTVGIEHPYRGAVTVVGGPGGRSTYVIQFADLDGEPCAGLASKLLGEVGGRSGLWRIQINGTAVPDGATRAQVGGLCPDQARANRVAWEYF